MGIGPGPALIIYTDASFDVQTGTGSWGAVIRDTGNEEQLAGVFSGSCHSSEQAELQAIAKVLHVLRQNEQLPIGRRVKVFTDNRACFQVLAGHARFKRNREAMVQAQEVVQRIIGALQLQFTVHWIQGHQPIGQSPHGDANRIADALARQANTALPDRRKIKAAAQRRRRARRSAERALARASAPAREGGAPPAAFADAQAECPA